MSMRARSLLRSPAVHFVLLGGACFALTTWLDSRGWRRSPALDTRIVIAAADVADLRRAWARDHGAPPDATTEQRLVQAAIDDEILYREAISAGLDRGDRSVRDRLAKLGRFLSDERGQDSAREGNDAEMADAARRLGVDQRDVVIRRHLVQTMRLLLGALPASELPRPADLEAYRDRHAERFTRREQLRLTHLYLTDDRKRGDREAEAKRLLEELQRSGAGPEAADGRGDPFIRGSTLVGSREELDRAFGPGFWQSIQNLEPRAWAGPVRSSYGLHLVWVHERIAARVLALDSVASQVAQQLLHERRLEQARVKLHELRRKYEIVVDAASVS
jgi:hypothetical protein